MITLALLKLILVWYVLLSIGVATAVTLAYIGWAEKKTWGPTQFFLQILIAWPLLLAVTIWEHLIWRLRTPKESRW